MELKNIHKQLSNLPDEILLKVFSFLPGRGDRCRCSAVSRKWLHLQLQLRPSELVITPADSEMDISDDDDDDFHYDYYDEDDKVDGYDAFRTLRGRMVNDMRLVGVAIGVYPRVLRELKLYQSLHSNPPLHHEMVTDFGLEMIGMSCPLLKTLSLSNCTQVTSVGLCYIAEGCNALENLFLIHSTIGNEGLVRVAQKCPMLLTLELESCPLIGDESLLAVAEHSSNLLFITLTRCTLVTEIGIVAVVTALPKLRDIALASVKLSDAAARVIGQRGESLEVIRLEYVQGATEAGFSTILEAQKVKYLALVSCSMLSDKTFTVSSFRSFINLKYVEIKHCLKFTQVGLIELTKHAHHLVNIKLENCGRFTTLGIMQSLLICRRTLKKLTLLKCHVSEDPEEERLLLRETYTSWVSENHAMRLMLRLEQCTGIGEVFLSWIGNVCYQAHAIAMIDMESITDVCVCRLMGAVYGTRSLYRLDLRGCKNITDTSIVAIVRAVGGTLKWLGLAGCTEVSSQRLGILGKGCPRLDHLDLSWCKVNDTTLMQISSALELNLKTIELMGCTNITDDGLAALQRFRWTLTSVNVTGCTRLTMAGIDSLYSSLIWGDIIRD